MESVYCAVWTELLHTIEVNLFFYQIQAQIILIHLLYSCTCFEHYYAHLQEDNCISTSEESDDTRCCTNTIAS